MFDKVVVCVTLIVILQSKSIKSSSPEGRIVGGHNANIVDLPHQVSLQFNGIHVCGGSVLSTDTILSAAHCVVGMPVGAWSIRAGSSQWNAGGQIIPIRENGITLHPLFNNTLRLQNDLLIGKLNFDLIFSSTIQPIRLPQPFSDVGAGELVLAIGWGALSFGSPHRPVDLQRVDIPVIDRATCHLEYIHIGGINDFDICAGAEGVGACQGDSGGPLVYRNEIIGVVSFAAGCGAYNFPGVFVRVSQYIGWINTFLI